MGLGAPRVMIWITMRAYARNEMSEIIEKLD